MGVVSYHDSKPITLLISDYVTCRKLFLKDCHGTLKRKCMVHLEVRKHKQFIVKYTYYEHPEKTSL